MIGEPIVCKTFDVFFKMELERKLVKSCYCQKTEKNEATGVDLQLLGLLGLFMESWPFNSSVTTSSNVTLADRVSTIYKL